MEHAIRVPFSYNGLIKIMRGAALPVSATARNQGFVKHMEA
jgi:hypothetical protein